MSQLFASGGQSIGASVAASVLLRTSKAWFPLELTGSISMQPTGLSRVLSTPQFKVINSLAFSLLYGPTLISIHDYWKNHSFDYTDFVGKMMSLLFNMLSRFFMVLLPRTKHLLISWLWSRSTVILEPRKIKSVTVSTFSHSICHGTRCHDLNLLNVEF